MTREEAIKQLDWYFDYDNGDAAEDKTKEAYILLRKTMFSGAVICPVCRDTMEWNDIIGRYQCPTCGRWDYDEDVV